MFYLQSLKICHYFILKRKLKQGKPRIKSAAANHYSTNTAIKIQKSQGSLFKKLPCPSLFIKRSKYVNANIAVFKQDPINIIVKFNIFALFS